MMSLDIEKTIELNRKRVGFVDGLYLSGQVAVRICKDGFSLPRNGSSVSYLRLLRAEGTRAIKPVDSDRVGIYFVSELFCRGLDMADILDYEVEGSRIIKVEDIEDVFATAGELAACGCGPFLQVGPLEVIEAEMLAKKDEIDDFFGTFDGLPTDLVSS